MESTPSICFKILTECPREEESAHPTYISESVLPCNSQIYRLNRHSCNITVILTSGIQVTKLQSNTQFIVRVTLMLPLNDVAR